MKDKRGTIKRLSDIEASSNQDWVKRLFYIGNTLELMYRIQLGPGT